MKNSLLCSVMACLFLAACKGSTTPSDAALTVQSIEVTSTNHTIIIGQTEQMTATLIMSDGSRKSGTGTWSCSPASVASVTQNGLVTGLSAGDVDVIFDHSSGKQGVNHLTVRALWTQSGAGNAVFDMPTYVSKVKIVADYDGWSSNFIVEIAGRGVVNELLGTRWGQIHFEDTYSTTGGRVEVKFTFGPTWSFSEVPPTT